MKHYELVLPENYKIDKVIDAKSPKTGIIMNVASLIIMIIIFIIEMAIYLSGKQEFKFEVGPKTFIALIVYFVGLFACIVLHELIHGLFYKIYTKQKLTFGITWSAAFCGVPNVYVKKKAMLVTCMAPCVIISCLLLIPLFLVNDLLFFMFILLVFGGHFGGCCGDIYDSILFITKYRKKEILVNDTGAKQTIYVKVNQ